MKVEALAKFARTPQEYRGKAILLEVDPEALSALRAMTSGHETERYRVEIKYHSKRSMSQNDLFHDTLRSYANQAGLEFEEAKAQIKHDHGVVYPFGPGFLPPTRPGQFVELYGEYEYHVTTADYTKEEMSRLIDGLNRSCAELG